MIGWMIGLSSANKTQNQSTFLLNRAWDELFEWAKDGLAVFPLNSPEVLIAHSSRGHFKHIWLYLCSPDILCPKPVLSCGIKSVCPPVKNFSTPVPLSPFYFHQCPIKMWSAMYIVQSSVLLSDQVVRWLGSDTREVHPNEPQVKLRYTHQAWFFLPRMRWWHTVKLATKI